MVRPNEKLIRSQQFIQTFSGIFKDTQQYSIMVRHTEEH